MSPDATVTNSIITDHVIVKRRTQIWKKKDLVKDNFNL